MTTYTKEVYKVTERGKGAREEKGEYVTEERLHKGPMVRTDDITNRQLMEILLEKPSKTGSQERAEAVVEALEEHRQYIMDAIQDYYNSKGGK